jgi:hypothetical protein
MNNDVITDENDIRIKIKQALKSQPREFVIDYAQMDSVLNLRPGSTASFIEEVAGQLEMVVLTKGHTMIEIRKPSPRIVRG